MSEKPCRCGCERPAIYRGKWFNDQCRRRFRRLGGPAPMPKCVHCNAGLSGPQRLGGSCGRCERRETSGPPPTELVALALVRRDPFPVQVSNPIAETRWRDDEIHLRTSILEATTCPRCGGPAVVEPELTRVINGTTSREKPIRCDRRNRCRQG